MRPAYLETGERLAGWRRADLRAGVQVDADGRGRIALSVPSVRCGQCIAAIERELAARDDVAAARVNLTLRRVDVTLKCPDADPLPVLEMLASLGYPATPIDGTAGEPEGQASSALLRASAVAGFGAMNVMLMSVAVWSGADGATRTTMHVASALIALPVIAYSGWPFFASALGALRGRRLNMDVPISLAVLLTLGLSLFETARGGEHAFYDAAVTLLFFLLVGRYLDCLMRDRARSAVAGLERLGAKRATVVRGDGSADYMPVDAIETGMVLRVEVGERVPVDVRVRRGESDVDRSLVTGESAPVAVGCDDELEAGTLNLTGTIDAVVVRPARQSFLAEMVRMLERAEAGRGSYVRVADRAARLYAPVVHLAAAATFAGWLVATGGDWRTSLFIAISVLIITCPCALGLAVPAAQVVAAGRLFGEGILMKDGAALERLAGVDRVVFDKTGTLTTGTPTVTGGPAAGEERAAAAGLGRRSAHPVARAVAAHLAGPAATPTEVREFPGHGVEGRVGGRLARLGRADWVAGIASGRGVSVTGAAFAFADGPLSTFPVAESLRPGAWAAVDALRADGLDIEILSGDAAGPVGRIARELGIGSYRFGQLPADKIGRLEALRAAGHRVLMVGDGLNDTAALAAADVSMAPASAADAGRLAADFVFTRNRLDAVAAAHGIARATARVVRQNFAFAAFYNCLAIPLAVAGQVTPLIAALAMSGSSILVVANALRLNGRGAGFAVRAPAASLAGAPA